MKPSLIVLLMCLPFCVNAQDEGCDKCSMLMEEYASAISPEKEKIYAYFVQECLHTDTVFVSGNGHTEPPVSATGFQVITSGKCVDFKEVKEFDKSTRRETRKYEVIKKDTVYTFATTQASFPGGDEELVNFLQHNMRHPLNASGGRTNGTVYVQFVVRRTGKITHIKMLRSPSPELTTEAIRLVSVMPDWKPATYKKEPVSMRYTIPVTFRAR